MTIFQLFLALGSTAFSNSEVSNSIANAIGLYGSALRVTVEVTNKEEGFDIKLVEWSGHNAKQSIAVV